MTPENPPKPTEKPRVSLPLVGDADAGDHIKVGDLAARSGKTVRALHLYEQMDLLHPVARSPGGFRLYAGDAAGRVAWIGKLQDLGFSLHEIRAFLRDYERSHTAPEAMARVRQIFVDKLEETRAHRQRLHALEKDLEASLAYLDVCHQCAEPLEVSACVGCRRYEHETDQDPPSLVAGLHLDPHD